MQVDRPMPTPRPAQLRRQVPPRTGAPTGADGSSTPALDAMAASQWRAITVDKLCRGRRLNKRTSTRASPDLDSWRPAAVDEIASRGQRRDPGGGRRGGHRIAGTPGQPPRWTRWCAPCVKDPRRARVLLGGVSTSPALHQHRESVMRGLTAVLVGHARTIHDVELARDPLAEIAPAFLIGGTADAILAFTDGRARVSVEQLVAGLVTLWLITGNGAARWPGPGFRTDRWGARRSRRRAGRAHARSAGCCRRPCGAAGRRRRRAP